MVPRAHVLSAIYKSPPHRNIVQTYQGIFTKIYFMYWLPACNPTNCVFRQVAGGAARFLRSDRWKKKRSPGKFQNLNLVNEEDGFYPRRYSPASVDTGSQPTSSTAFSGPKLARRLDYQLPAGFTERKLGYAAFTSHTSYWFNQDLASFVINQLITEEESSTWSKL